MTDTLTRRKSEILNSQVTYTVDIFQAIGHTIVTSMRKKRTIESHNIDIFDERKYPLNSNSPTQFLCMPSIEEVSAFMKGIVLDEYVPVEVAIVAMVYVDKIMVKTGILINVYNWRRLLLATFIVAYKLLDDQTIWNVDFINCFPGLLVYDLNRLELEVLFTLEYVLIIPTYVYAQYYKQLWLIAKKEGYEFEIRRTEKIGCISSDSNSNSNSNSTDQSSKTNELTISGEMIRTLPIDDHNSPSRY
jgi:hypothetical protein